MWAEKRPHEWLGGVLGVLGLALSTYISQIKQKVLKGYELKELVRRGLVLQINLPVLTLPISL